MGEGGRGGGRGGGEGGDGVGIFEPQNFFFFRYQNPYMNRF